MAVGTWNNSKLFRQFLDFCKNVTDHDQEVIKLLEKRHKKTSEIYLASDEFGDLMSNTTNKIKKNSKQKFVYIKEFITELKAYGPKTSHSKRNHEEEESSSQKKARTILSDEKTKNELQSNTEGKVQEPSSKHDDSGSSETKVTTTVNLSDAEIGGNPNCSKDNHKETEVDDNKSDLPNASEAFASCLGLSPRVPNAPRRLSLNKSHKLDVVTTAVLDQDKVRVSKASSSLFLDKDLESSDADKPGNKASEKQIKKLEGLLEKISREISKLEAEELDLDDLDQDNSNYILLDKYKAKSIKIWEKLCEVKGRASSTGRPVERRFKYEGTRYPEINRKVEKFINRHKEFPDYQDIRSILNLQNKKHHLRLNKKVLESLAKDVFTEVGNKLQERRQEDLVADFGCHLTDKYKAYDDPAMYDRDLKKKLEQNKSLAKCRLEEVINKFAQKQMGEEDTSEDEEDEEDDRDSMRQKSPRHENRPEDSDSAIEDVDEDDDYDDDRRSSRGSPRCDQADKLEPDVPTLKMSSKKRRDNFRKFFSDSVDSTSEMQAMAGDVASPSTQSDDIILLNSDTSESDICATKVGKKESTQIGSDEPDEPNSPAKKYELPPDDTLTPNMETPHPEKLSNVLETDVSSKAELKEVRRIETTLLINDSSDNKQGDDTNDSESDCIIKTSSEQGKATFSPPSSGKTRKRKLGEMLTVYGLDNFNEVSDSSEDSDCSVKQHHKRQKPGAVSPASPQPSTSKQSPRYSPTSPALSSQGSNKSLKLQIQDIRSLYDVGNQWTFDVSESNKGCRSGASGVVSLSSDACEFTDVNSSPKIPNSGPFKHRRQDHSGRNVHIDISQEILSETSEKQSQLGQAVSEALMPAQISKSRSASPEKISQETAEYLSMNECSHPDSANDEGSVSVSECDIPQEHGKQPTFFSKAGSESPVMLIDMSESSQDSVQNMKLNEPQCKVADKLKIHGDEPEISDGTFQSSQMFKKPEQCKQNEKIDEHRESRAKDLHCTVAEVDLESESDTGVAQGQVNEIKSLQISISDSQAETCDSENELEAFEVQNEGATVSEKANDKMDACESDVDVVLCSQPKTEDDIVMVASPSPTSKDTNIIVPSYEEDFDDSFVDKFDGFLDPESPDVDYIVAEVVSDIMEYVISENCDKLSTSACQSNIAADVGQEAADCESKETEPDADDDVESTADDQVTLCSDSSVQVDNPAQAGTTKYVDLKMDTKTPTTACTTAKSTSSPAKLIKPKIFSPSKLKLSNNAVKIASLALKASLDKLGHRKPKHRSSSKAEYPIVTCDTEDSEKQAESEDNDEMDFENDSESSPDDRKTPTEEDRSVYVSLPDSVETGKTDLKSIPKSAISRDVIAPDSLLDSSALEKRSSIPSHNVSSLEEICLNFLSSNSNTRTKSSLENICLTTSQSDTEETMASPMDISYSQSDSEVQCSRASKNKNRHNTSFKSDCAHKDKNLVSLSNKPQKSSSSIEKLKDCTMRSSSGTSASKSSVDTSSPANESSGRENSRKTECTAQKPNSPFNDSDIQKHKSSCDSNSNKKQQSSTKDSSSQDNKHSAHKTSDEKKNIEDCKPDNGGQNSSSSQVSKESSTSDIIILIEDSQTDTMSDRSVSKSTDIMVLSGVKLKTERKSDHSVKKSTAEVSKHKSRKEDASPITIMEDEGEPRIKSKSKRKAETNYTSDEGSDSSDSILITHVDAGNKIKKKKTEKRVQNLNIPKQSQMQKPAQFGELSSNLPEGLNLTMICKSVVSKVVNERGRCPTPPVQDSGKLSANGLSLGGSVPQKSGIVKVSGPRMSRAPQMVMQQKNIAPRIVAMPNRTGSAVRGGAEVTRFTSGSKRFVAVPTRPSMAAMKITPSTRFTNTSAPMRPGVPTVRQIAPNQLQRRPMVNRPDVPMVGVQRSPRKTFLPRTGFTSTPIRNMNRQYPTNPPHRGRTQLYQPSRTHTQTSNPQITGVYKNVSGGVISNRQNQQSRSTNNMTQFRNQRQPVPQQQQLQRQQHQSTRVQTGRVLVTSQRGVPSGMTSNRNMASQRRHAPQTVTSTHGAKSKHRQRAKSGEVIVLSDTE